MGRFRETTPCDASYGLRWRTRAVVLQRRRAGLDLTAHFGNESYPNLSITASLANISITPAASVIHAETNSPATWHEALQSADFFKLDKNSLSLLALDKESFPKVVTVVDSSIASTPDTIFAIPCITDELKIQEVDFTTLKTEQSTVAPGTKEKEDPKIEGAVQIAIGVKKEVDFSAWYQSVLLKADMLEYYSVSGCYILRPWSFSIWEEIQEWFNKRIKAMGVQNVYFPMFVSSKVLEREKDHIEGFSPEVAWVTRAGSSELEGSPSPFRPTSETVMYPYYAKWIKSHRDLPLKLNQWNNVPFLRTREYLWQEGHTAHLSKADADKELLAVPMIKGIKSEKEKFAGALYTTTSDEVFQAGTSHCLGQNFSRPEMFNIVVEDPNDPSGQGKLYAWQNSWGLSTRTIGVMVMVHGDNQGLVLPPRVAYVQVVVVPKINDACDELAKSLVDIGVRAKADLREGYTPGYKFNDWEQKGVPLRLEIGPNDLVKQQTVSVRRDTGAKAPIPLSELKTVVPVLLETIHKDMYTKALNEYNSRLKEVTRWEDFVPTLDNKCVAEEACEDDIKERSARSRSAIPFDQDRFTPLEPGKAKCVGCGKDAKRWTMFGRSY
ncbi:hypothetical protein BKA83DRAFT_4287547 [Pisolithus microcarpus]|nr:hypothetical protein BKA83DRAFT_4287547 [Pisolithus microcarpus]